MTYIHTSHKDDIYMVNNSEALYQYSVQLSKIYLSCEYVFNFICVNRIPLI